MLEQQKGVLENEEEYSGIYQCINDAYIQTLGTCITKYNHQIRLQEANQHKVQNCQAVSIWKSLSCCPSAHVTHYIDYPNRLYGIVNRSHLAVPIYYNCWLTINLLGSKQHIQNTHQVQIQYYLNSEMRTVKGRSTLIYSGPIQQQNKQQQPAMAYNICLIQQQQPQSSKTFRPYCGIFIQQKCSRQSNVPNQVQQAAIQLCLPVPALIYQHHQYYAKPIFVAFNSLFYVAGFSFKQLKVWFHQPIKSHSQSLVQAFNNNIIKIQSSLSLGDQNIGVQGLKYIQGQSANKQTTTVPIHLTLTNLNLWWNMLALKGAYVINQSHYPQLQTLNLRKNFITDTGLQYFNINSQQTVRFPNLERLFLSDNNLSTADVLCQTIYDANFPSLLQLQLQNNAYKSLNRQGGHMNQDENKSFQPKIAILELKHSRLKILSLRIGNNNLVSVGHLFLPCLKQLYLSSNYLTTLQWMFQGNICNVRKVALDRNRITQVRGLRKLWGLSYIDLSYNPINQLTNWQYLHLSQLIYLKINQPKSNNPSTTGNANMNANNINNNHNDGHRRYLNAHHRQQGSQIALTNKYSSIFGRDQDRINNINCICKWEFGRGAKQPVQAKQNTETQQNQQFKESNNIIRTYSSVGQSEHAKISKQLAFSSHEKPVDEPILKGCKKQEIKLYLQRQNFKQNTKVITKLLMQKINPHLCTLKIL